MQALIEEAERMGLRVAWRNLGRRSGQLHSSGLVVLNPSSSDLTQRVTLAHEMGHWHHGHDWSLGHSVERDERQADRYAAHLLIDPLDYERAAICTSGHAGAIAKEIGVTRRLVELWQESPRATFRCGRLRLA